MTAYENHGVRQEVMDRGAAAFLQKPVDEGTLLEAIRKASKMRKKIETNLTGI
jgi:FixJ family two-component response regulator